METVEDSLCLVMMETTLMEMVVAMTVKFKLDGHAQEVLQTRKILVLELYLEL